MIKFRDLIKQIDYFRLSTELDLDESSSVINKIMDIINPMKALQEKVILENKGALYSEQEQKMIKEIKLEAEKYSKEKNVLFSFICLLLLCSIFLR